MPIETPPKTVACDTRRKLAIGAEALADLGGELAGRRQNERAAGARSGAALDLGQTVEDRQREGRGLAGAGLGDAEQIAALQQFGNGARLDRRRDLVAFARQRFEQRGLRPSSLKLSQ